MTTKHAVWLALHTPASTLAVATAMSLDYQLVANAVRDLRKTKHVEFVVWRNRQAIYKAVGELKPEGRGTWERSNKRVVRTTTPHEQRWDRGQRVSGYGSGRCALEEVWR